MSVNVVCDGRHGADDREVDAVARAFDVIVIVGDAGPGKADG